MGGYATSSTRGFGYGYGAKGYGGGYGAKGYGGGYGAKGYGGGYGGYAHKGKGCGCGGGHGGCKGGGCKGGGCKGKAGDGCSCPSCQRSMYRYLALAMALFVVVASPAAFRLTGSILGIVSAGLARSVVGSGGLPTFLGLVAHAVVYVTALKAAKKLVVY